jgi:hypothetical protein
VRKTCSECGRYFPYEQVGRGRPPLTCSDDCQRLRHNRLSYASRDRLAAKGCPPDKHGTNTGHSVYKCRCNKCTRWARLYRQKRRAAN